MSPVPVLGADDPFPAPATALRRPNGLLAIGGDLSPERLLAAYRHGIFPWYEDPQPILWWSPDPRAVLYPDRFHASGSLRAALRRAELRTTADTVFAQVIDACAAPRRQTADTWIGPAMRRAYLELHARGHAHSVEVWSAGELVGGLYGIALGRVFFGESMFSRASNASKIALAHLVRRLLAWGYVLIDCQQDTPHMRSLGAETIARREFQGILDREASAPVPAASWREAWAVGGEAWETR